MDRLGIGAVCARGEGCCGAVSHHLGAHEEGLAFMRRNIDAWWPHIEAGAETIVNASSACSLMIKDYGTALKDDPDYADKAAAVSGMARDLSELLGDEDLARLNTGTRQGRVAFHCPCTLQHGQRGAGAIEPMLRDLGYRGDRGTRRPLVLRLGGDLFYIAAAPVPPAPGRQGRRPGGR